MSPTFSATERTAAESLIGLALAEDLGDAGDITSAALLSNDQRARVDVVARHAGVVCGNPIAEMVYAALDSQVRWTQVTADGNPVESGEPLATVEGPLCLLLTGERTALNFLTHLSGVASLTQRFVAAMAGTRAQILDTRKTLPGYRRLQKYAVRCGGGTNHRLGLFDGCLIKDNHLAGWSASSTGRTIADAVRQARSAVARDIPIEVEVDTLKQLVDALAAGPDVVLLDNMDPQTLSQAVKLRDEAAPQVQLEASGGITLRNVAAIAATGVERISIGGLTHSAIALDLAFDWGGSV